jgi:hypothetical protein
VGAVGREITVEELGEVAALEQMGLELNDRQRQFLADLWVMTMEEAPVEIEGVTITLPGGYILRFRAKQEKETF